MKFSIIHASARPREWNKSALAYYQNASGIHKIEYILVTEPSIDWSKLDYYELGCKNIVTLRYINRNCGTLEDNAIFTYVGQTPKSAVSHWNQGASKATGDIIILNSDDMFPPKNWDEKLAEAWENGVKCKELAKSHVIRIGYTRENQKGLMALQVMTKGYYQFQGYAMYPGFQSVYADNDFTSCAEELGVVIEASDIIWEHRHPVYTGQDLDEIYKTENEDIRYKYGKALYEFRKSIGYKAILGLEAPKKQSQDVIAVCTPGKEFPADFLFEFGQLAIKLFCNGGYVHAPSKSCNIYTARSECLEAINQVGVPVDYLFWVDSDQLEYVKAFERLYKRMKEHPEIDILAGWTYMQHDAKVNAGWFNRDTNGDKGLEIQEDGKFGVTTMTAIETVEPFKVEWIGFACVLMKSSVVTKLAPDIFSPIYVHKGKTHWVSEDQGFSMRALEKEIDIYVDPLAYVKHMKLQEVLPAKAMVA